MAKLICIDLSNVAYENISLLQINAATRKLRCVGTLDSGVTIYDLKLTLRSQVAIYHVFTPASWIIYFRPLKVKEEKVSFIIAIQDLVSTVTSYNH